MCLWERSQSVLTQRHSFLTETVRRPEEKMLYLGNSLAVHWLGLEDSASPAKDWGSDSICLPSSVIKKKKKALFEVIGKEWVNGRWVCLWRKVVLVIFLLINFLS